LAVNDLLRTNYRAETIVHVVNPDASAASRLAVFIGESNVIRHGGLPEALQHSHESWRGIG